MRSAKVVAVVGLLIAALGLRLWPSSSGAQQPSPTGTVPPGIIVKSPAESDLQVSVRVGPGPFVAGRQVEKDFITLSLNKQAVVYLLLINPEKEVIIGSTTFKVREVRLLFPNRDFRGNFLQQGEYKFPGTGLWERPFEIPGPPGTAYVQVIATPVPIGLEPQTFEEPFPLLGIAPNLVKQEIERRIQQKGLLPADWAASWTQYEVLRSAPLSPQLAGNLRVTILDRQTRQRLTEALIFVDSELRGITNAAGEAIVSFLPAGKHKVRVTRNGYEATEAVVTIENQRETSQVFELMPLPPKAALMARPVEAFVGDEILLDASGSTGSIILYEWVFDNNCARDACVIEARTRVPTIRHVYQKAGPYKPKVIVVFEDGSTAWESVSVVIKPRIVVGEGEPGSAIVKRSPLTPPPGVPVVNPITLALVSGGVEFIVANTSHREHRQFADIAVQPGPATLEFNYRIDTLPDRIGGGSNVEIQSYIVVQLFSATSDRPLTEGKVFTINTQSSQGLCQASGGGGSQRPPVARGEWDWLSCKLALTVPANTAFVVIKVGLDIPRNASSRMVVIAYKNLELKSK